MLTSSIITKLEENILFLGEPWKLPKAAGFLIPLTDEGPHKTREYVLLQEQSEQVIFKDSGGISGVEAQNNSGHHVFVRKGTMLHGLGTQSRAPIHGFILDKDPRIVRIPVNCIHQSHGISRGSLLKPEGVTPHTVYASLGRQSSTWASINSHVEKTRELSSGLNSVLSGPQFDDLLRVENAIKDDPVLDILKHIPGDHVNQVGVVIFDLKGVVALEVFDHPESWHSFSKSIIRSYGGILTKEAGELIEIKTENASKVFDRFIQSIKESKRVLITENQVSQIWSIENNELEGEIAEINGSEIHLHIQRQVQDKPTYDFSFESVPDLESSVEIDDRSQLFLERRGGYQILDTLKQASSRFSEILENVSVSRGTLASRIREAEELGLIDKGIRKSNGSPAYILTDKGDQLKQKGDKKAK